MIPSIACLTRASLPRRPSARNWRGSLRARRYTYQGEVYEDGGKECYVDDGVCSDGNGLVRARARAAAMSFSSLSKLTRESPLR